MVYKVYEFSSDRADSLLPPLRCDFIYTNFVFFLLLLFFCCFYCFGLIVAYVFFYYTLTQNNQFFTIKYILIKLKSMTWMTNFNDLFLVKMILEWNLIIMYSFVMELQYRQQRKWKRKKNSTNYGNFNLFCIDDRHFNGFLYKFIIISWLYIVYYNVERWFF